VLEFYRFFLSIVDSVNSWFEGSVCFKLSIQSVLAENCWGRKSVNPGVLLKCSFGPAVKALVSIPMSQFRQSFLVTYSLFPMASGWLSAVSWFALNALLFKVVQGLRTCRIAFFVVGIWYVMRSTLLASKFIWSASCSRLTELVVGSND